MLIIPTNCAISAEQCYRERFLMTAWRRGRDSNPRDPFGPNGFQDRRIKPLSHPSVFLYSTQNATWLPELLSLSCDRTVSYSIESSGNGVVRH